jgi:hypothetical protein
MLRELDGDNFNDLHLFALLGEQDITKTKLMNISSMVTLKHWIRKGNKCN